MTKRLRRLAMCVLAVGGLGLAACHPASTVTDAINTQFGSLAGQATAIAECESGLDPHAISPGGGNWGLFQINTVHKPWVESLGYSWDQMLDPYANAHVAKLLYNQSGWQPWTCSFVL